MARKKGVYLHKWDISILEQVAASCNIAAKAQLKSDWDIFLEAVYDAIRILSHKERTILLLSQEVGIPLIDIARILDMPRSTTLVTMQGAVDKIVFFLKSRSLTRKDIFDSKAMQLIYSESVDLEELDHDPEHVGVHHKYPTPWFYPKNFLADLVYGKQECKDAERSA
jgi:hypothetical protein